MWDAPGEIYEAIVRVLEQQQREREAEERREQLRARLKGA